MRLSETMNVLSPLMQNVHAWNAEAERQTAQARLQTNDTARAMCEAESETYRRCAQQLESMLTQLQFAVREELREVRPVMAEPAR